MFYSKCYLMVSMILWSCFHFGQQIDSAQIKQIYNFSLTRSSCYENLRSLCKDVGHRLSGSPSAQKAVEWGYDLMSSMQLDSVYLQAVRVPRWVRGDVEKVLWKDKDGNTKNTNCTALGGSIGTDGIIKGKVVEIKSWKELDSLGKTNLKGKIVFFNRPMNPTYISTFMAYGSCVDQRHNGASRAGLYGAKAVIVRSMTLKMDHNPHTGSMSYVDSITKIPAAAISSKDAHELSQELKNNNVKFLSMELSCQQKPDTISYNVIGEITGKQFPNEVILVGGHLDSWDIGEGAHDDGAGVIQSIQVLESIKKLNIKPKRTIRCVLYMNEENGNRGGKTYAEIVRKKGEKHLFALESDRGGFSPRGFSIDGTPLQLQFIQGFEPLFEPYQLHLFNKGYGGVDIGPLRNGTTCLVGLVPDSQRYFDYHHAPTDVFENVNKRELELGSSAITSMIYLIDKYGFPDRNDYKQ